MYFAKLSIVTLGLFGWAAALPAADTLNTRVTACEACAAAGKGCEQTDLGWICTPTKLARDEPLETRVTACEACAAAGKGCRQTDLGWICTPVNKRQASTDQGKVCGACATLGYGCKQNGDGTWTCGDPL